MGRVGAESGRLSLVCASIWAMSSTSSPIPSMVTTHGQISRLPPRRPPPGSLVLFWPKNKIASGRGTKRSRTMNPSGEVGTLHQPADRVLRTIIALLPVCALNRAVNLTSSPFPSMVTAHGQISPFRSRLLPPGSLALLREEQDRTRKRDEPGREVRNHGPLRGSGNPSSSRESRPMDLRPFELTKSAMPSRDDLAIW
jgi:hypothetical protein